MYIQYIFNSRRHNERNNIKCFFLTAKASKQTITKEERLKLNELLKREKWRMNNTNV